MFENKIVFEDRPAWYELGYQDRALILKVTDQAYAKVQELATPTICGGIRKNLGLPPFEPPTNETWGFANKLQKPVSLEPGWHTIQCPLVQLTHNSDWQPLYEISASLGVVILMLNEHDEVQTETPGNRCQLLTLDGLRVERDVHGGHFGISLSKPLAHWLGQFNEKNIDPVIDVMHEAFNHMFYRGVERHSLNFGASVRDERWLHMHVPGSCSCLDRDGSTMHRYPEGYPLSTHNVDGPLQQLSLLAGLGRLCDLARKDIYGT